MILSFKPYIVICIFECAIHTVAQAYNINKAINIYFYIISNYMTEGRK